MFLFALVCPPLVSYFIFLILNLINQKYIKEFIFINSLILSYTIPMADILSRYRVLNKDYLNMQNKILFDSLKSNEVVYELFFSIGKILNFNYYVVLFMSILIINYIWFTIYNNYQKEIKSKFIKNYMFLLFTFSLLHRNILDLNKFFLALMIFIYSFIKIDINRSKKYLLLMILAIFVHNSMFIILFIYFISNILRIKSIKMSRILLGLIILLSLFKNNIFEKIYPYIELINAEVGTKLYIYIFGGYWNKRIFLESNFKGLLTYYTLNLSVLVFILYLLINIPQNKKLLKLWNFNFYLGLSSIFFLRSYVFNERLGNAFLMSFVVYLYFEYIILEKNYIKLKKIKKINYSIILILILIRLVLNIYIYGFRIYDYNKYDRLKKGHNALQISMKILYIPGILLLNFDNGYNDFWIEENSNNDFERLDMLR